MKQPTEIKKALKLLRTAKTELEYQICASVLGVKYSDIWNACNMENLLCFLNIIRKFYPENTTHRNKRRLTYTVVEYPQTIYNNLINASCYNQQQRIIRHGLHTLINCQCPRSQLIQSCLKV